MARQKIGYNFRDVSSPGACMTSITVGPPEEGAKFVEPKTPPHYDDGTWCEFCGVCVPRTVKVGDTDACPACAKAFRERDQGRAAGQEAFELYDERRRPAENANNSRKGEVLT